MTFSFESPFFRALGAPPTIIGLMGSIGSLMLGLVRIPGAYIADKYGRRQIIVTMTFVIAFSYLFYIFALDWKFVLVGMILSSLALIYQPALDAILADSIPPEKRGMGYAAVNVIPSIPTIFAPVIAIKLGEMLGAFKSSIGAIAEAWKEMPKTLKFVTVAFLISAFEEPMFRMFASLYVFDVVGVNEIEWGLVNTASIAMTLVFGFPFGKIVDKIGRKKSILIAYSVYIPSTFFFLSSRSFPHLLIVYLIFAAGGCLIMPGYNALLADLIPREKRGRIMGTIITLNILATQY